MKQTRPDKRSADNEKGRQEHVEEAGVDLPVEGDVEPGCGVDVPCAVVGPGEVTLISELFVGHIILWEANP